MGADDYYVEPSADEIFSGPTHELVPSSYSSFHRFHWPHHQGDEDREESQRGRRGSMWSRRSDTSAFIEEEQDEVGHFHFFSTDEISHAEGASTVAGDDDSIHESYYGGSSGDEGGSMAAFSDSDGSDDNEDGEHRHRRHRASRRRSLRSNSVRRFDHHGSGSGSGAGASGIGGIGGGGVGAGATSDGSDDEHTSSDELLGEEHRFHPFLDGVHDSDDSIDEDGMQLGGDHGDARSHREYRSRRFQQRYYIAEEDMRIVCAGYSTVKWRLMVYRALCVVSLGIVYLLGRWFPRQLLRFTASETPLGKCGFVVIENQWGELEEVSVETQRYNHGLSTIFNLATMDAPFSGEVTPEEAATDEATPGETGNSANGTHNPVETASSRSRRSSVSSYVDNDPSVPYLRTITYRYIRFLYNPVKDMFFTNSDWVSTNWETVEKASEGLDGEVQEQREQVFGPNSLHIKQPPTIKLLMDEVLHPFYIFQVFSIILWCLDEYLYYASAIFIISVVSVAEALAETKKSMSRLAAVAHANEETEITVLRSGFWLTIPSEELVPGDVYELSQPTLSMIPVDSVLLSGDCIVNESILTGESVPVSKLPATDAGMKALVADGLHSPAIGRSLVYSGTKIIRVRKPPAENDDFLPALALVVRTGFTTTKGALLRSMMFPKPSGFRFYRDSFRYIGVMAVVALFGFSISAFNFVRLGMDASLIVLRALDIITVVVPPALPATLTIGTNFSLQRLREKSIFCITPSRVNVGGRVNLVAFDKTGTLTDEGLDVLGVHLVNNHQHHQHHHQQQHHQQHQHHHQQHHHQPGNGHRLKFGSLLKSANEICENSEDTSLLDTLVTCHELRCVDDTIMGDPLDLKMFEFTNWHFEEDRKRFTSPASQKLSRELKVYKQFEFVSQLRRMSVVTSSGSSTNTNMRVLAKGAPEIMRQICLPETLPMNFDEVLHQYTHRGYRVIACAWREIKDITDYDRNELEAGLTFAGLIVFENKLKPESKPSIETLNKAGIRTLMCTGDNLLTAISVARECSIIPSSSFKTPVFAGHFDEVGNLKWEGIDNPSLKLDPMTLKPLVPLGPNAEDYILAVTGDVFSHIVERGNFEALDQMLLRGVVFARMSPDEKHELVSKLQRIDYTTCFCGDGANDCGALKEADVGISLSEAEASVAAPFTSRRFDISCVLDVLAEGRCALTTSFGCFKYMSMYSAIQFVTVTILYDYGSNIGDFQFLWIDLFLIVPIAAFMAWSGPAPQLARKRPGAELVSSKVLVPLLSYIILVAVAQVVAWTLCHKEPYYITPIPGDNDNLKSTDNTTLFFVSSFQYIMSGWIFCDGLPFRIPVVQNVPFLSTVLITVLITLGFMLADPSSKVGDLMDLTQLSYAFKLKLLVLTVLTLASMVVANRYLFIPLCNFVSVVGRVLGSHKSRPRYKEILDETASEV